MLTDSRLRRLTVIFAIIGLVVALYLVFIKFNPSSTLCLAAGGCERVNTSAYSEIRGIPIAILGSLAYLFILGITLLEQRMAFLGEWGAVLVFGLALAGTLYSAYLTYIELAVLHAICPYCVTSAIMITLIFIVSAIRLRKYL